jgi:hypothetical protein
MKLNNKVKLIFADDKGNTKELETTFKELIDSSEMGLNEQLEDDCNDSSCKVNNFCECEPMYENYSITEVVVL